jgi:hypothetical protein
VFYSRLRRHSTLGGASQAEFEMRRLWHSQVSKELGKGHGRIPPSLQITQQVFHGSHVISFAVRLTFDVSRLPIASWPPTGFVHSEAVDRSPDPT